MAGNVPESPPRREAGLHRLLAAEHRGLRSAEHLDVAHRVLEVPGAGVTDEDGRGTAQPRDWSARTRAPPGPWQPPRWRCRGSPARPPRPAVAPPPTPP